MEATVIHCVRTQLKSLLSTGFFHIFGAGTINKVISALLSIVVVRILSKEDFGIYSYVYNLVSFFVLFNGLGVTSALLQLGCEAKADGDVVDVLRYSIKMGVFFDALLAILMLLASFFPMNFPESPLLLRLYALYPMVILIFDVRLILYRIKLENKRYAFLTNIQTLLLALFSIVGAYLWQVVGLIAGQYLAYVISGVLAWLPSMALRMTGRERRSIPGLDKKAFWKLSITSSINNGLGSALSLVGVFLIGFLTGNEYAVAEYKVATTIPFALLFIPGAVVTYIYPYFVRHRDDPQWSLSRYLQLIAIGLFGYGSLAAICCVVGERLITLVFGAQYEGATRAFQIMMLGFFATSALRQPTGNLLVTQRKLWFNTFTGALSLLLCCALCVLLVPAIGVEGAAWAYALAMIAGALCNVPYYISILVRMRKPSKNEKPSHHGIRAERD